MIVDIKNVSQSPLSFCKRYETFKEGVVYAAIEVPYEGPFPDHKLFEALADKIASDYKQAHNRCIQRVMFNLREGKIILTVQPNPKPM